MAFALAREQLVFIERMVVSGRFNNQSEVVREALRRLQREEDDYLRPPPLPASVARRIYRRDAAWERVERAAAGRARPE
jgi:putative addiction module CopG family antidote